MTHAGSPTPCSSTSPAGSRRVAHSMSASARVATRCTYMGDAVIERANDIIASLASGGTLVVEMYLHSDKLVASR